MLDAIIILSCYIWQFLPQVDFIIFFSYDYLFMKDKYVHNTHLICIKIKSHIKFFMQGNNEKGYCRKHSKET